MAYENEETQQSDEKLIKQALSNFKLADEGNSEIRLKGQEDLQFLAGDQWPQDVKAERFQDGRPCLVINRMPQFIRQITNDQRQNRPSIKVHPVDDKGDIETAKVLQGLIRHIEYNSNADVAYDSSFEGAVRKGFGYFRILTDYVSPDSFDQEILIKKIANDFMVQFDPHSKEPDGSDADFAFVFEDIPKNRFKAEYPNAKLCSMDDWSSIGTQVDGWVTNDSVRVAEYFYKEYKEVDLVQFLDGSVIEKSKLPKDTPKEFIKNERKSLKPVIKWCKLNGVEVLDKADWPGRWIPIVPVYGDELIVNGKRILEGVIRHSKDSQRMYNYWASTETETIALAPRAPFIVAEGQIPKGYEHTWKTANRKNHAYLPYKPTDLKGALIGPPQRNTFEAPVQAITQARMLASEDIKATTGIYDAAIGAQSNETSGIAIQRRANQAQTSNFHFVDNLRRSQRHGGRIILDLIPHIYDSTRAARIIGEDDEQKIVFLNREYDQDGKQVNYRTDIGKYDVVVENGPSYATKRQEAAASMVQLSQAYPQIMQIAGDLMVRNMDWPQSSEIAERLKKTLPPGLADDPNKQMQLPPEVQARLQEQNQMIEALTQTLNEATDQIKTKKMELETKERIEMKKLEVDLALKEMDLKGAAANEIFFAELQRINKRLELLDINQPINSDFMEGNEPDQFQSPPIDQQQLTGESSPGTSMGEV